MVYEYQRLLSENKWHGCWRIKMKPGMFSDYLKWLSSYQQYYTENERIESRNVRVADDSIYDFVFDGINRQNIFQDR